MNEHITALPVVLAATGIEAQSYQPALKTTLGDINIGDPCHKQVSKGVEQEILSVLEAFKQTKEDEEAEPAQSRTVFVTDLYDDYSIVLMSQPDNSRESQLFFPNPSLRVGIKIRASSLPLLA